MMKKNNLMIWGFLLLVAAMLTACGGKNAAQTPDSPAQELPGTAEHETAAVVEVENNGGNYVRVGDRVYFRRYGADALPESAAFGEFTTSWNISNGESDLMALDPATGALSLLYTETGLGSLWYGDNGFYLQERVNDKDYTWWYALDGSGAEELSPGTPLGITESGLLAVENWHSGENFETEYRFYRDKALVGKLEMEDTPYFVGLSDDGLFLLDVRNPGEETVSRTLYQITPEGKLLNLGALPAPEDDFPYYEIQADRFLAADGKVYAGIGYYAGTGHFLNESVFVEATVGQENSLQKLSPNITGDENGELPKLIANDAGGVAFVSALPGELRLGWENEEEGALEVWDDGSWHVLKEYFCPPMTDGFGYRRIVQHMEYIDGAAYVTLACAHEAPADAIGWRDAFALLDMLYLKVDAEGGVTELSAVDHDAELYGNVWFIEGESTLLWQHLASTENGDLYESSYVYAIPIAEDAYWEGGWESAFDGTTGLLPYDYGDGKADYYGFPRPDAEPAGTLCLTLDRDGVVTALSRKDPEAALMIDFDVPDSELKGAVETLDLRRRASDEDTQWFWAKVRVLENNVHVRIDRTPEQQSVMEERAMQSDGFIVGETVFDRVLNRGDYLAVRASLPWRPELRISADKDGAWGAYTFGEDNYQHLETKDSVHPELTLAVYPLPDRTEYSGDGMRASVRETWLYYPTDTGKLAATLSIGENVMIQDEENSWELMYKLDQRFYGMSEGGMPDLLELNTDDPAAAERIGFSGGVGDYLVELFRTDGEEILHLTQVNNGDGALTSLLPCPEGRWAYEFVLTRSRGAAEPGARRRNATFPAEAVKFDRDNGLLWLQEAEIADEGEDGSPVWRANPKAPCLAYSLADKGIRDNVSRSWDTDYPMTVYHVSVDGNAAVTRMTLPDAG